MPARADARLCLLRARGRAPRRRERSRRSRAADAGSSTTKTRSRRPGGDVRAQAVDLGGLRRIHRARARQLLPQEQAAEVRDARACVVVLSRLLQEPADLDRQHLRRCSAANLPIFGTASPGICSRVHRRLDGALGPALLRAHVRVRRADAADGRGRAGALAPRAAAIGSSGARRTSSTACSPARSSISSSPATADLPLHRAVLDVRPARPTP